MKVSLLSFQGDKELDYPGPFREKVLKALKGERRMRGGRDGV